MTTRTKDRIYYWSTVVPLVSMLLYLHSEYKDQQAIIDRKREEWKDILDSWQDDPQSAANHLVLGMDLDQRRKARGIAGKKSVPTWV